MGKVSLWGYPSPKGPAIPFVSSRFYFIKLSLNKAKVNQQILAKILLSFHEKKKEAKKSGEPLRGALRIAGGYVAAPP